MVLHWAISIVSCFQANGMQFVDGNANDRGCQLKERDCRTQWGASSHYDPRGVLESIHGYRMSKVPQAILDVWSFFHYLAYDPKHTPFGQRCLLLGSCFSEKRRKPPHSSQFKSQKCRINYVLFYNGDVFYLKLNCLDRCRYLCVFKYQQDVELSVPSHKQHQRHCGCLEARCLTLPQELWFCLA